MRPAAILETKLIAFGQSSKFIGTSAKFCLEKDE